MFHVLVEDNRVIGVLTYAPEVPPSVKVYAITVDMNNSLNEGTHYFDVAAEKICPIPKELEVHQLKLKALKDSRAFLADTDWMVLRHIREQALELPLTLTQEQYIDLEKQRHDAAAKISK